MTATIVRECGRACLSRRAASRGTRSVTRLATLAIGAVALLGAAARAAGAQRFISLGGAEVRAGVADVVEADKKFNAAFDLDLGYVWRPFLRTSLGYDFFNGGIDRTVAGTRIGGTLKGNGLQGTVRADLLTASRVSPYALLGLTWHNVSVSGVRDPTVANLIEGNYFGFGYGAGAAWRFGRAFQWAVVGDLRRVEAGNAARTLVTAGLRYQRLGRGAYVMQQDSLP
ncbi:MAG: outer membrane beta-barrel protein [Gemmatimonadaceae bacterium]